MARLGYKTVGAALRYQHSESGRDAIVAAILSANALAELAAVAEQIDTDPPGRRTCVEQVGLASCVIPEPPGIGDLGEGPLGGDGRDGDRRIAGRAAVGRPRRGIRLVAASRSRTRDQLMPRLRCFLTRPQIGRASWASSPGAWTPRDSGAILAGTSTATLGYSKLVDVTDAVQDVSRNDCAHRRRSAPTAAYFARTLRADSCRLDEVPLGDHILFLVSHHDLAPAQ